MNLTIKTRLILAFTILILLMGGIFYIGSSFLDGMNQRINRITDTTVNKILYATDINKAILIAAKAEKNVILTESEAEMKTHIEVIESQKQEIQRLISALKELEAGQSNDNIETFVAKWEAYLVKFNELKILALLNSNKKAYLLSRDEAAPLFYQAVNQLKSLEAATVERSEVNILFKINTINSGLKQLYLVQKELILATDERSMEALFDEYKNLEKILEDEISAFGTTLTSANDRLTFQNFRNDYANFKKASEQIAALTLENGNKKATAISTNDARQLLDNAMQAMNLLISKYQNQLDKDKMSSDENYSLARSSMILVLLVAAVMVIIIAYWIISSISNSIKEAKKALSAIASGDLTVDITIKNKDEIGELLESLQKTINKLKSILGSVRSAIMNIAAASQQMSSTSQQMSEGSTEQAASTEEVSSSMEEMTGSIQQNTDNAMQTEKIAVTAADSITETTTSVNQTLASMKEIADKISIVEDIANKTDLLALNAAVEAARAGEHGKGFAVVASAVRKLAENSQRSANEINKLTVSSVTVSENSQKLLANVAPEIQRTSQLVQEISASSREQNSGAEQINIAIQQLNQVTQQNAAAAEELASSSEELSSQAQELESIISFFKVDDEVQTAKAKAHVTNSNRHNIHMSPLKRPNISKVATHRNGLQIDLNDDDQLDKNFEQY